MFKAEAHANPPQKCHGMQEVDYERIIGEMNAKRPALSHRTTVPNRMPGGGGLFATNKQHGESNYDQMRKLSDKSLLAKLICQDSVIIWTSRNFSKMKIYFYVFFQKLWNGNLSRAANRQRCVEFGESTNQTGQFKLLIAARLIKNEGSRYRYPRQVLLSRREQVPY